MSARSGTVVIGGQPIESLPQSATGRRIAYVGQDAYVFGASLRDNLLYGVRNEPRCAVSHAGPALTLAEARRAEDRLAGNAPYDIEADWLDYKALGIEGPAGVDWALMGFVTLAGLEADVFRFGLQGTFDPE